jgi:hypothetical protein
MRVFRLERDQELTFLDFTSASWTKEQGELECLWPTSEDMGQEIRETFLTLQFSQFFYLACNAYYAKVT